jgi:hypothetical protein
MEGSPNVAFNIVATLSVTQLIPALPAAVRAHLPQAART